MPVHSNRARTFVAVFAVTALALFAILLAAPFRPFVDRFSQHLASLSARVITALGGTCLQRGAILSNPAKGFAMEVRDGCNGVNVVILLWAAILAYPTSLKWKAIGLCGGMAAIQAVNLLRLVSLFYLGQYSPSIFEFAHLYLWESLIILDGMIVFSLWTKHAANR
jgi:exosortase H (IPTLxxWG-CTERM-specific)